MKRNGFSLVELSIVLVILGLLVGGVLAGQSLIRASEIRSILTNQQRYLTAVHAFRDKYFALPGDMANASSFWGTAASCPGTYTTPSAGLPTCNGDGDGAVHTNEDIRRDEMFRTWHHLSNAGLIEGRYTGVQGANDSRDSVPGENIPVGKMLEGYNLISTNFFAGSTTQYEYNYGTRFVIGLYTSPGYGLSRTGFLKPEELWNIDSKGDDGRPATGKIMVYGWTNCTTSTLDTDFAGTYNFTNTNRDCAVIFARQI